MAASDSVEDYLASLPPERRATLERLRQVIRSVAPEATEAISYQIPTFKDQGRMLVSYAAFAEHYSLFPASGTVADALGDQLTPYRSGKGTIRFSYDEPLPVDLVERVVRARLEENAARRRR
jgi:uncharacterized protein YdhG (YjbR/CyaY superfamily)